jgi:hypothetical protein
MTMTLKTLILPAMIAVIALPAVAQAQRAGAWQTIGQQKVAFGVETDTFPARGNRRHRQVRLCASRDDIKLLDADVRFANGGEQDILGNKRTLRAGRCTAAMDLRGNRRNIVQVKVAYSRFNTGRAPRLTVQAR